MDVCVHMAGLLSSVPTIELQLQLVNVVGVFLRNKNDCLDPCFICHIARIQAPLRASSVTDHLASGLCRNLLTYSLCGRKAGSRAGFILWLKIYKMWSAGSW